MDKFEKMVERLPELKEACNKALQIVGKKVRDKYAPNEMCVNWGDLSCVRTEVYFDDGGHFGYRVLVEEADPDNAEFQVEVSRELDGLGFSDVYVETSW